MSCLFEGIIPPPTPPWAKVTKFEVTAGLVTITYTTEPEGVHQYAILSHATRCPLQQGTFSRSPDLYPPCTPTYHLAGCGLITVGSKVLLVQRAASMRAFPGQWVCPGGQAEGTESSAAAALREVQEETGLRIDPTQTPLRLFAIWESCYPVEPSEAPPRKMHVVAFYLVQLRGSVVPEVKVCEESQGYAWVDVLGFREVSTATMDLSEGTRFVMGKFEEWWRAPTWNPLSEDTREGKL